jgi:hypothetical protein
MPLPPSPAQPSSVPPPPPPPPSRPATSLREGSVQRFDAEDLRKLASASKAVLGAVARETARELVDRRRERRGRPPRGHAVPEPMSAPPQRRRRFKRRWVVVPVLVTVA